MGSIFKGKFRITSGYKLPDRPSHDGLDMVGDEDNHVYSASEGIVNQIQYWDGKTKTGMQSYGNLVIVKGYDGRYYYYAHLKSINVSNGQDVSIGTVIGIMGTTGNSTGNHTHFEIRNNDKKTRMNPADYLGIPNAKGTYKGEIGEVATFKGIDVSKHQGTIDWKKVKNSGIDFAIIRAGYGRFISQKDIQFDNNLKGVKNNNIPYGFYWYSYATSVEEAKQEANICLQVIKGSNPIYPVFFDQEYEPGIVALNNTTRTNICLAFLKVIENAGFKGGIYCSWDWIKNKLNASSLTKYPKWIAHYSSACGYKEDDLAIWQYTSTGRINGIRGNVDLNYGYVDYSAKAEEGKWEKINNKWRWKYTNGSYAVNKWIKVDNRWYYMDNSGYCMTGYQIINGKPYYLAEQYALDNKIKECQLIMTDTNGAII